MTSHDSINYRLDGGIATITIDDGKRNALPPTVLKGIYAALRRAESDQAPVILTGREGVFSAGFDLKVMKAGNADTLRMLRAGYSLTARIMAYPHPVVAACSGHSMAMGLFMMLSCDYIIGIEGDFNLTANEVALGLTMPRVACTVMQQRLSPAAYQRAVNLSEYFHPGNAVAAGLFDEVVQPQALTQRARECAEQFAELDARAHRDTKRRIRAEQIKAVRRQVPLDLVDAVKFGLRGGKPKR